MSHEYYRLNDQESILVQHFRVLDSRTKEALLDIVQAQARAIEYKNDNVVILVAAAGK